MSRAILVSKLSRRNRNMHRRCTSTDNVDAPTTSTDARESQCEYTYTSNSTTEQDPAYLEMLAELRDVLAEDIACCDAKWSLFVGAAMNYKYEELLQPYPPGFLDDEKDLYIERLLTVISDTPKLSILLERIETNDFEGISCSVIELVHWVLITSNNYNLRYVDRQEFSMLMYNIEQNIEVQQPTHVFEVCYPQNCQEEARFHYCSMEYGTNYSFCGYKADHLYTVLNNGFGNESHKLNLPGVADKDLHLSSELAISLSHSAATPCWGRSSCGGVLRCVAICEFINHPDYIKSSFDEKLNCSNITITKPDIVRPRYLIFYGKRFPPEKSMYLKYASKWISKNKQMLSIGCFMVLFGCLAYLNMKHDSDLTPYFEHVINQSIKFSKHFYGRHY